MLATTLDLDANPFLTALKSVDKGVDGLRNRLTGLVAGFAGLHIVQDIGRMFEKFHGALDLGKELSDVSAATGQSVSDMMVLRQAFKLAGMGSEGVLGPLAKFQKALGGVSEDGQGTLGVLDKLGVSTQEIASKTAIEQIEMLQKAFGKISSQTEKAALVQQLFGKKGTKMLVLLGEPEIMNHAREQVGGLGAVMERMAPTFSRLADVIAGLDLKFMQLTAGALSVVAPQFLSLADAINHLDLTNVGVALGYVVLAFVKVAAAVKFLLPVVISLGAGWLASMAATQVASIGIVSAVRAVTLATVGGMRAIMVSLGPVGLAIAALTFLWLKFHKAAAPKVEVPSLSEPLAADAANLPSKLGVGSMTQRGLNAFAGVAGQTSNPVVSRLDRTNSLLERVHEAIKAGRSIATPMNRPDVPV